jgi:hypothetical protein
MKQKSAHFIETLSGLYKERRLAVKQESSNFPDAKENWNIVFAFDDDTGGDASRVIIETYYGAQSILELDASDRNTNLAYLLMALKEYHNVAENYIELLESIAMGTADQNTKNEFLKKMATEV